MPPCSRVVRYGAAGALALLALSGAPPVVSGQETVGELAAGCGDPAWCREVALAGQAARAGFGLLSSGGSEVPGSAGTLGWRLSSVPRVAMAAEVAGARVPFPVLGTERRAVLDGDPFFAPALRFTGAVGVFDGFSPVPTVGGLFSLDLVASGGWVFLPEDRGFDGSAAGYGAGVRVGILRESFTLPGISVSAARRWGGEVTLTGVGGAGAVVPEAAFDPSVTSVRATVGKDVLAVGLLAGAGWDRYGGDLRIDSGLSSPGTAPREAATDEMADSRFLVFGGASLNYLILQLSAELGWAGGMDPVPGRPAGGFDPGGSSWYGSVGARLTL